MKTFEKKLTESYPTGDTDMVRFYVFVLMVFISISFSFFQ